ncbi:MAG: hypothetical protein VX902_05190, partial [Planctomycetota bacterium]|nr:hypothetical protein [Planctomycetota bacterium]
GVLDIDPYSLWKSGPTGTAIVWMNKLSAFLRSRTTLHHTKGRARKVRRKFASAGGKILRLFWLTLTMTNLRPHASLLLPEFPPPLT